MPNESKIVAVHHVEQKKLNWESHRVSAINEQE
jgi:hypothetical protein